MTEQCSAQTVKCVAQCNSPEASRCSLCLITVCTTWWKR